MTRDGRNGGGRRRKPLRKIPFGDVEAQFTLAAIPEWRSPAVGRRHTGVDGNTGWYIRVLSQGIRPWALTATPRYDYFRLADDGEILRAPRGYGKDFKPGRLMYPGGMAALAARFGGGS